MGRLAPAGVAPNWPALAAIAPGVAANEYATAAWVVHPTGIDEGLHGLHPVLVIRGSLLAGAVLDPLDERILHHDGDGVAPADLVGSKLKPLPFLSKNISSDDPQRRCHPAVAGSLLLLSFQLWHRNRWRSEEQGRGSSDQLQAS